MDDNEQTILSSNLPKGQGPERSSRQKPSRGPKKQPRNHKQSRAPKLKKPAKASPVQAEAPQAESTPRFHPVNIFRQLGALLALWLGPLARTVGQWIVRHIWPVLSPISLLGWLVIAVTIIFAVLGFSFGWLEALALSVLCFVVLLVALVFIIGKSAYGVHLDLARTRVAVGDHAVGSISVKNTSQRALLPASLELPVGQNTAVFSLPRMAAGQVHEDLFNIPTVRRAVIVVGPVRSVRADPLRLLRRQVRWTDPTDLFVHPQTTPLLGTAAGFIHDLEGIPSTELSNSDVAFHALRDYVPGDDRRHIHWKTTARTGALMVRQFEQTRRAHIAIALSTNATEYEYESDFELAVSAAASIGKQTLYEERELSTLVQQGPVHTATGRVFLDDMTRVQAADKSTSIVDLARVLSDEVPNASVVFIITGSNVTPSQLRAASAAVEQGVRCFAIRCVQGAATARNNIADLPVLTIGALDDLPSALRRAQA